MLHKQFVWVKLVGTEMDFLQGCFCMCAKKRLSRGLKLIQHLSIIMSFLKCDISTLMIENHTASYLKMTKLKCLYFIPKVLKSWQFLSFWSHSWRSCASQCEIHRKSCNPELISDLIDYWSNQRPDWLRWCERPIYQLLKAELWLAVLDRQSIDKQSWIESRAL